jgi:hypothetical protein
MNTLSEETLVMIASFTAAAYHFDIEMVPDMIDDIWSADSGLASLSSSSRQMRRICAPLMFARLHLFVSASIDHSGAIRGDILQPTIERLKRILSYREGIACMIRCVI